MREGIVYIWFDTVRRMFYIGSHEGQPGDGYKTSSTWCRKPNRAKTHIFTQVDGAELTIDNLSKYLRENNIPSIKLGKYLKNGEAIFSFRNPNHPFTGWKIRHG